MKKILTAVAVAVAGITAVAVAVPASAGAQKAHLAGSTTIKVGDNYFVRPGGRPTVSVKSGTTLNFRWVGRAPHDVVVTKGPASFRSGAAKVRGSYSKKVTKKGTYTIICTVHGAAMGLTLKVR